MDGIREWIQEGKTNETLVIAHDGSYMSTDSTSLCSAGVVILCTATKQWLKASLAKRSLCASNYRGELLGALMALLILQAASSHLPPTTTTTVVLHCDNKGVNSHGNSKLRSLPEKQRQADLIRHIKHISQTIPVQVKWEWVEGHAVERKGRHRSTVPERLNDQADKLAKAALLLAISGGNAYKGDYPFEMVSIKLTGKRVSGSPRQALQDHWGYIMLQNNFSVKRTSSDLNTFI
jgi:ribonuclease HI